MPHCTLPWHESSHDRPARVHVPSLAHQEGRPLTPREHEVLDLLARGATDREIAHELGVSVHTVHNHVHNVYLKWSCTRRAHLIARYYGAEPFGDTSQEGE